MAEKVAAINRVTAREGEITIPSNHKSNSILSTSVLTERKQIMTTATLNIKAIRVQKLNKENSKTKAFVDISIDDAVIIKNIKVIEGENGLFVGLPSEKSRTTEKWYPFIRFNKETFEDVTNTVLAAYKNE